MLKKIIFTNVLFFFSAIIIESIYSNSFEDIRNLLGVSHSIESLIKKPWVIITHMFTHLDPFHILINMIFLYIFGKIFLEYLNTKKLFSNYILGGIFGAIFFMIFNNIYDLSQENTSLIGSSASILSILATTITFTPNYSFKINRNLNFSIKLKFVAILLILYSIIQPIFSNNIGGLIAHVGGVFYGITYVFFIKKNINLGYIIEKIFTLNLQKNNKKIKRKYEDDYEYNTKKKIEEIELNKILDKISQSGYNSLSKKEKELLKKYSQN